MFSNDDIGKNNFKVVLNQCFTISFNFISMILTYTKLFQFSIRLECEISRLISSF